MAADTQTTQRGSIAAPAPEDVTPRATRRSRLMTIIAQDPDVKHPDTGSIVRAQVPVPVDRLEDGPRSHRFHVVDYDSTTGALAPPADLTDPDEPDLSHRPWGYRDRFADVPATAEGDRLLLADPTFHAQNVYAIAARTLAAFEFALGRRVEWEFPGHQLYLVPHAFLEGNAYYAREDHGVLFGYLPRNDGTTVFTCLSHDIVAHETTHAILDGLRPRFLEPALPDQPAFHEALGDIVALLSVFSIDELVKAQLSKDQEAKRHISAGEGLREKLAASALFGLAEEFGRATSGGRGSALRRSIGLPHGDGWRNDPAFEEPHRRGEVLVAAIMYALLGMWTRRLDEVAHSDAVSLQIAAEEGAKAASHLLTMVIRSLDYAPAVELDFEDVLEAILVADEEVAPDDRHKYRMAVEQGFGVYGIERPAGRIVDVWALPVQPRYDNVNAAALRFNPDEVFRFVWQNLAVLELRPEFELEIEAVRPAVRVGPDGLIVNEVVADYIQVLDLTAAQAADAGMTIPAGVGPETEIQVWGGGTLIFDQFGRLKLHERKPLGDWERQSRRLEYLARHGLVDTRRRLGFSTGGTVGMRFADLHAPDRGAGEEW